MKFEGSYKNYRSALASVVPPCIPYIGVYLMDLTFTDEGNPDKIGNLINFNKRNLVGKIISEIDMYRREKYVELKKTSVAQFIEQLPRLSEKELYQRSLECEPRDAPKSSLK